MRNKHEFASIRTALVPVVHGCSAATAVAAARAVARDVVLVGFVRIPEAERLSAGAARAREVRRELHRLGRGTPVRVRDYVRVSYAPWEDLLRVMAQERPDLLVLDWACHVKALGVAIAEILSRPPCDVALVRGPIPEKVGRVLVPMRGGPHAELALRLGLSLKPDHLVTLHIRPTQEDGGDAAFQGLDQVLAHMPEVQARSAVTDDPAAMITSEAQDFELIVMGATARSLRSRTSLGPVADRVLKESQAAVMAVKTRRPMPLAPPDQLSGAQAISILVDKWFSENTFHASEFGDLRRLVALKEARGETISLALPALNEEATVGKVIRLIKSALMEQVPLLDEIVLIDSNSTDRTREIAADLGVPVYIHQELLPELGARRGKGEALWKSLLVTRGDLVAWIDTDIVNIHPRFVYGILGPLLQHRHVQFVKGFYRRPLKVGDKVQAGGGGRVTELLARPLLNLFYPELSGVIQPLSGEYAGRRAALEQVAFYSGYGVEIGLLIDLFEQHGLSAIAQVDLLERVHHNQPLEALSKMSFTILQAVMRKLERRFGRPMLEDVNRSMKLIRYQTGTYFLDVEEVVERERPPMAELPQYRNRRRRPARGRAR